MRAPLTAMRPSWDSVALTGFKRKTPSMPVKTERTVAGSRRSPRTSRAPCGSPFAFPGSRVKMVTSAPRVTSSRATCDPTVPVPPITRTFIGRSFSDAARPESPQGPPHRTLSPRPGREEQGRKPSGLLHRDFHQIDRKGAVVLDFDLFRSAVPAHFRRRHELAVAGPGRVQVNLDQRELVLHRARVVRHFSKRNVPIRSEDHTPASVRSEEATSD